MNSEELAAIYFDLRNIPVADMTDDQLALWLQGCATIGPCAKSEADRMLWRERWIEAKFQIARRKS